MHDKRSAQSEYCIYDDVHVIMTVDQQSESGLLEGPTTTTQNAAFNNKTSSEELISTATSKLTTPWRQGCWRHTASVFMTAKQQFMVRSNFNCLGHDGCQLVGNWPTFYSDTIWCSTLLMLHAVTTHWHPPTTTRVPVSCLRSPSIQCVSAITVSLQADYMCFVPDAGYLALPVSLLTRCWRGGFPQWHPSVAIIQLRRRTVSWIWICLTARSHAKVKMPVHRILWLPVAVTCSVRR